MNKAWLLWLWYDYHTEKYDQGLHSVPSEHDEGSVIVVGPDRSLSDKYARHSRNIIHDIAKFHLVSWEDMQVEKTYRLRQTTKIRIAEYEKIVEHIPHELQFIETYLTLLDHITYHPKIKGVVFNESKSSRGELD